MVGEQTWAAPNSNDLMRCSTQHHAGLLYLVPSGRIAPQRAGLSPLLRKIKPSLPGDFQGTPQYLLVIPSGNGQGTLWLVTQAGSFRVQRLTL